MKENISECYEQAQSMLEGLMPGRLVLNDAVLSCWIENSACFWYIKETQAGKEYRLVDAAKGVNGLAFDHKALADALAEAVGQTVDWRNLPVEGKGAFISLSPWKFEFAAFGREWTFDESGVLACRPEESRQACKQVNDPVFAGEAMSAIRSPRQALDSPDGKRSLFTCKHNLWVRNNTTGEEIELTSDGCSDYRYAVDLFDSEPVVQAIWSPCSRYVFTVALDTRKVRTTNFPVYVPNNHSIHLQISASKFAFAGDGEIECHHLVLIDLETETITPINYPPLPLIAYGDPAMGFFTAKLGWWSSDSDRVYFVDVNRGSKTVKVMALDLAIGEAVEILREDSDTFVKLRHSLYDKPMFRALTESNELIWFSERSGWGHLYLYDLAGGELRGQITGGATSEGSGGEDSPWRGEWLVRDVLYWDGERRELIIQTAGRDINVNPYYRDICSVNIDTGELKTVVSGNYDFCVYNPSTLILLEFEPLGIDRSMVNGVSPGGEFIVATYSRVDTVPVTVLLDRRGNEILRLEEADTSALPDYWQWPEPVRLVSADGITDTYGVVFHPIGFSPKSKYPVLEYSSAGRMLSTLPQGSFFNSTQGGIDYLLMAALAALGFVVIQIEGRGLPLRSKKFQDYQYGDHAFTSNYEDRISGIRQLAERYSHMDLERVGITGIEGASNTAYGPLKHADFYKVGVVHHAYDPRFSPAMLGEVYDGTAAGEKQRNVMFPEDYAANCRGKILLICRLLSFSTPAAPLRIIEALKCAGKSFDTLCLPNSVYPFSTYVLRREWDYLVTHLQNVEPPTDFPLKTGRDLLTEYIKSKS